MKTKKQMKYATKTIIQYGCWFVAGIALCAIGCYFKKDVIICTGILMTAGSFALFPIAYTIAKVYQDKDWQ